jgi:hypothetical protein
VLDKAAAARIAVSPMRMMEQRGTGDGGNKEEVDDQAIGKEMTATATAANGRPYLGATARKIRRAYCQCLGGDLRHHTLALGHGSAEFLLGLLLGEGGGGGGGSGIVWTFVEPRHSNLVLRISDPSTKHQARGLLSLAGMVQFWNPSVADGEGGVMVHTGVASVHVASSIGLGRMPLFADMPLGAALRVDMSMHVRYAMVDKLNAELYNYDAGGDNGCPLLVLTPVEESHHVFCRGRERGYAAVADASNWDFGQDWVTMTTLTTIQPCPLDTTTTRNNQLEQRREEEKERTSQGGGSSGKKGGGL